MFDTNRMVHNNGWLMTLMFAFITYFVLEFVCQTLQSGVIMSIWQNAN
jgi:ABC-type bacteriocin/lantibiotic exporter with double-glycine peptidase domain